MRYNKIRKTDIANGPGIRVSIFMQGCTFNCKGCFNPDTHSFKGGKEFNDSVIEKVIDLAKSDHIRGLSILGGEPMHSKNIGGTLSLVHKFKEKYPNKDVWVWTLYNPTLKYRGSSNQRVIDVNKSLKKKKIMLYEGVE